MQLKNESALDVWNPVIFTFRKIGVEMEIAMSLPNKTM